MAVSQGCDLQALHLLWQKPWRGETTAHMAIHVLELLVMDQQVRGPVHLDR